METIIYVYKLETILEKKYDYEYIIMKMYYYYHFNIVLFHYLCIVLGIFAYLNHLTPKSREEIIILLVNGLKRLEYRGYDSAGK